MDNYEAVRSALRGDPILHRRAARADRTRALAFAPGRILFRLAMVPVTTVAVTVSLFAATSGFEREDSLRHLLALGGCDMAAKLGMAHMAEGAPGYHKALDADGNGIVCEDPTLALLTPEAPQPEGAAPQPAPISGAKFIRP